MYISVGIREIIFFDTLYFIKFSSFKALYIAILISLFNPIVYSDFNLERPSKRFFLIWITSCKDDNVNWISGLQRY